jgi:hypothetical protein
MDIENVKKDIFEIKVLSQEEQPYEDFCSPLPKVSLDHVLERETPYGAYHPVALAQIGLEYIGSYTVTKDKYYIELAEEYHKVHIKQFKMLYKMTGDVFLRIFLRI